MTLPSTAARLLGVGGSLLLLSPSSLLSPFPSSLCALSTLSELPEVAEVWLALRDIPCAARFCELVLALETALFRDAVRDKPISLPELPERGSFGFGDGDTGVSDARFRRTSFGLDWS